MGSDDYKNSEVLLPTKIVKDNILRMRTKKGYKQVHLAQELGITEKAYRNIEQGQAKRCRTKYS
jgi:DNA-binding XRE family transcriptional regulator